MTGDDRGHRPRTSLVIVLLVALASGAAVLAPTAGAVALHPTSAHASSSTRRRIRTKAKRAGKTVPAAAAPPPTPPFGLGEVTTVLTDPTRSTPDSSARSFTVTTYYPTADPAGTLTSGAAPSGSYPLVVFSHGYDVSAGTYVTLEREIAADGFVVAAPDFPLSSSAVTDDPQRDPVEQASDVSFVIRTFTDPATVPVPLSGAVARTKVGVIGQSDGGITTAGVAYNDAYADPAVGAAVVLTGAEAFFPGGWFDKQAPPLLAIHGDADQINPYGASQQLFDDATGPKWLVTALGGDHLGPSTDAPWVQPVGTLVDAFFNAELRGDTADGPLVTADAGVPGVLALAASG